MQTFVEVLIVLATFWLVWRLVTKILRPRAPAEPAEEPFAPVPANRKQGPRGRSGAVALEEPDELSRPRCFPAKNDLTFRNSSLYLRKNEIMCSTHESERTRSVLSSPRTRARPEKLRPGVPESK